jgi:hypothetical protein
MTHEKKKSAHFQTELEVMVGYPSRTQKQSSSSLSEKKAPRPKAAFGGLFGWKMLTYKDLQGKHIAIPSTEPDSISGKCNLSAPRALYLQKNELDLNLLPVAGDLYRKMT